MNTLKRSFFPLLICLVACWLAGCEGQAVTELLLKGEKSNISDKTTAARFNARMIDSAIGLLQDGDMVLRTGNDATSHMLTQMNQTDKTFSHCGFVRVEHGYPFVYHAIGGEDNPNEAVRRDSAKKWFSPVSNQGLGIARFHLDTAQRRVLSNTIYQYYRQKVKFDMDFDLATDDRMYCAELIYKAVSKAADNPEFFTPVKAFGYTYINVENLYHNSHTKLIWQVRYK